MPSICLVIDGGSPFADTTSTVLSPLFDRVLRTGVGMPDLPELALDLDDDASWNRMSDALLRRYGALDALVFCAPPVDVPGGQVIARQWFALREMLRLLPEGERGVFLSQHLAPDDASPARAAAIEGQRIGMGAAVIDGIAMGRRPRANRLVLDEKAAPSAVAETVRFLCDARSAFLCGAEVALDATLSEGDSRLDGRTILITGATSGLGRAAAVLAGKLGAFVAIGGRKAPLAEETLAMVREAGGDGMVVPLDVTDASAWARGIESVVAARGALHGLVNNAGESVNRRLDQLTGDDLGFLLAVNYTGTVLGMDAALGALRASGGGSIVNVSSVAGIRGGPGAAAYSTTKAAVIGESLSRARALAGDTTRIRVNALQPGLIWSDSVADSLGEAGAQAFRARIEPQTPLGRVTTPEEVAEPLCWLLSEAAAPVTGQAIHVSGGLELNFP
ncbi:SDR family NAD(P)-dependent oxidoreductase [Novosphingobium kaempferiae]|uniref:SDR family NAD(P)-dependent oxidoreductase n=1 Tax=Novosphingobium kaempferiae TaxID=2896849 RepID=UPI001E2F31DA|nr:SDR family NAD(P)-dependent oxidoreductase [Novosphingobium kaempferiae]